MTLTALAMCFGGVSVASAALLPRQASNPISVAGTNFLGYRNSSNTQSLRDLGFMGNVGDTWILAFGDATGTKNINDLDVNTGQGSCQTLTGRDGGAVAGDDPLSYRDISTTTFGNCGDVPQMAYWCPLIEDEADWSGLGITNVIQVNSSTGVIWTRPTNGTNVYGTPGAGLAKVTVGQGDPVCTRPFGIHTWDYDEPTWGQLGAISGVNDGYTYVYANGYNADGGQNNQVVLARVPKGLEFELDEYDYYHGPGPDFNKERIRISDLNADSPENLGFLAGQGSIFYSSHYQKYVYLTNRPFAFDVTNFYALTADNPWGPWTSDDDRVLLYNDEYPYPERTSKSSSEYGLYIQPKYTSADGKTITASFTRAAYYEGVVEITFA